MMDVKEISQKYYQLKSLKWLLIKFCSGVNTDIIPSVFSTAGSAGIAHSDIKNRLIENYKRNMILKIKTEIETLESWFKINNLDFEEKGDKL